MSRKKQEQDQCEIKPYSQKYSLQRRDEEGAFRRVDTFSQLVTPEDVLKRYGSGYYILRSTKPRLKTVWKKKVGTDEWKKVEVLEKRAKLLTYGFTGVAATEIIGFGLSAWKFLSIDERLDKIETVLQLFKPELQCLACHKPLDRYLQKYCSQCGSPINWPRKFFQTANTLPCFRCNFPLQIHQTFCTNCGQPRPIQIEYEFRREASPSGGKVAF